MIYVNIDSIVITDEKLLKDIEKAEEDLLKCPEADRNQFIKDNSSIWIRVRPYLASLNDCDETDCKCWYCESKGPGFTPHVDHFRPKGRVLNEGCKPEIGYWWLAFDYKNYRLSCERCNTGRGKRDQFPIQIGSKRALKADDQTEEEVVLLLDPTNKTDPELLAFSEDGRVYPAVTDKNDIRYLRAYKSRKIYNLDHPAKKEARRQTWIQCMNLVLSGNKARRGLTSKSNEARIVAREWLECIIRDIKEKVSKKSAYSAMARYCFKGTGEKWVIDLIESVT